jgi:hypothetical protein
LLIDCTGHHPKTAGADENKSAIIVQARQKSLNRNGDSSVLRTRGPNLAIWGYESATQ